MSQTDVDTHTQQQLAEIIERKDYEIQRYQKLVETFIDDYYKSFPLPPEEVRAHVAPSGSESDFLTKGYVLHKRVLGVFGTEPTGPILDWGCGSGRIARWLIAHPAWQTHYTGSDVDREAIEWMKAHIHPNVHVNQDDPPLPFEDQHFSGLFSHSILTHIDPKKHRAWYEGLWRVLKPGALAYITHHGHIAFEQSPHLHPYRGTYEDEGWAYVQCPGHYKDASAVTYAYTVSQIEGLFTVEQYDDTKHQDEYVLKRLP